ncbi:MAG: primosomal protein N' [Clostridia bacterium]|nr:primosomal protein N' [Clostridia bacterium]
MVNGVKIAKIAVSSAVFSFDKPFDYLAPSSMEDIASGQRVLVPFGRGNKPTEGFVLSVQEEAVVPEKVKEILHLYRDGVFLTQEEIRLALWMRSKYFCSFFECANAMIPPGMWQRVAEKYALASGMKEDDFPMERKKLAICLVLQNAGCAMSEAELQKTTGIPKLAAEIRLMVGEGILTVEKKFSGKSYQRTITGVSLAVHPPYDEKLLGRGTAKEKRLAVLKLLREVGELPERELCYQTGAAASHVKDLAQKGMVSLREIPSYMAVEDELPEPVQPFRLSMEQQAVYDDLLTISETGEASCALLQGITGSGKTAVYIELIRAALARGKSALMLVPEIALTPQMLRGFRQHFGNQVAVLHSELTTVKRYEEYMRIRTGRAKVIIGTRSAVFAPCEDLGLVIIDEEHETTYKSDSAPRYDAVEVAKYRCVKSGCLLLLGSATPSVESRYHAEEGKYHYFTLEHRYNEADLPATIMADMKSELKKGTGYSIGTVLQEEIFRNLERGEQTILFINRRGNAKMAMCTDCGYIPTCENCSVSLTYHSANGRLLCHHCGHSIPLVTKCPECGGSHIKLVGIGTQKIEEELAALFPNIRVLRMDTDTTSGRRSHEEILDAFGRGEADILLGTQMVAKGLDFPNVTLVGVIDADLALSGGHYLAGERSFSLISQVVGRAGRRDKPGRAVIQSFSPEHPIIEAAARQDYEAFYRYELDIRQLIKAPPFSDIFTFFFSSEDEEKTELAAQKMAQGMKAAFRGKYADLQTAILGPAPAAIARINNKYRFVLTFKGKETTRSRALLSDLLSWFSAQPEARGITVAADINSISY